MTDALRRPVDQAWEGLHRVVPRGAILLSILTFGSYLFGLVRDRILTSTFGAGPELDTFAAAFRIPELLFGVIVASGLAAPFVPIFTELRRDVGRDAADAFGQTILTLAVMVMGIVAIVLFVIAPWTVEIVAPGFGPEQREQYTVMFRIMAATQVLFAASMAIGEVLVADRRFFFYGTAPLLYNLGIVIGTVALADRIGIYAPAVGALLGAAMHAGIRLVGVIARTTFRVRARLAVGTAEVREFFRLAVPKAVSGPVEPITFLYFTNVASTLVAGSIVTVDLARNFQSVPVSLIGVAFSIAAFPGLAAAYNAHDRRGLSRLAATQGLTIGLLTIGAAIGLIVVGPLAIDVLLGSGRFDADDVARTAAALSVFALAVPFESLGHLVSRAIYATHHTIGQVVATLAGFAVTIAGTQLLLDELGALAIPAGWAMGVAVRFVLLVLVFLARLRRMPATPDAPPPVEPVAVEAVSPPAPPPSASAPSG
jgi:putative peptidoglycan lipid II flippase